MQVLYKPFEIREGFSQSMEGMDHGRQFLIWEKQYSKRKVINVILIEFLVSHRAIDKPCWTLRVYHSGIRQI